MELPGLLESMAEASVTLAGFAAVFRAFATGDDPDGYSTVRLTIVIEGGLAIAFLCYVPAALAAAGLTPEIAWRASNVVAVAWILPRSCWVGFVIARRGRPLPSLFPLAYGLAIVALAAVLGGVLGLLPPKSAHQLGLVSQLGGIGCTFLAQFRVERARQ
jgi:hypothetical protein